MPFLPVLSGRQVVQAFVALGWHVARQRGSHIPSRMATLSVPDHKEVAKGALRSLIRAAGLAAEAFGAEAEKH
jgi:predicted RNA binding protein YcfA (HicA-like mRNA interferase family)